MFKDFGISEADWNATPQSVKTVVVALQHQARLLEIRFTAYEKRLADMEASNPHGIRQPKFHHCKQRSPNIGGILWIVRRAE